MKNKGSILIQAIVFTAIFLIIVAGLLQYVTILNKSATNEQNREKAFEIAESGIDYYQWVLTHDKEDYCDGHTPCDKSPGTERGPYEHEFKDPMGSVIGHYQIWITEPEIGGVVVTVKSEGYLDSNPSYKRKVQAKLGIPTIADYMFLCNSNMSFSSTSEVFGKVHSNGGINFNGINHSAVASARETYEYTPGRTEPGVWGNGGPQELWEFPVDWIEFSNFQANLTNLKNEAIANGIFLDSITDDGYHLTFQNTGTIVINKVTRSSTIIGIMRETYYNTVPMPANGLIFVQDDVWVDGTVNGRATIAAGKFSSMEKANIKINGNITYNTGMGTDVLGLLAEKDVEIGVWCPDHTIIYAAMLAQEGRIYRNLQNNSVKDRIDIYGSMIFNLEGWVKGTYHGRFTGYRETSYNYDSNLLQNPPPFFPSPTLENYEILSWQEI
ncbi:MAG: hypothetical protein ACD_48C00689G0002 [uncultured bacterium]|nr:MAG: hypothetical protein ACD_48C00689G0002 [uncultured bacterium]